LLQSLLIWCNIIHGLIFKLPIEFYNLPGEAMEKKNCWEICNCGHEPGGNKVAIDGVCPASIETSADGIHGGKNAGRACWAIQKTLSCGENRPKTEYQWENCRRCFFYWDVLSAEKDNYASIHEIMQKVNKCSTPVRLTPALFY